MASSEGEDNNAFNAVRADYLGRCLKMCHLISQATDASVMTILDSIIMMKREAKL